MHSTPAYKEIRNRYKVAISTQTIGGVLTEIFMPESGVAPRNTQRVPINLHGGAFLGGSGTASQLESIPIASVAKIKVIGVDYRMAPECSFPAASEDVEAVYREPIKSYDPKKHRHLWLKGWAGSSATKASRNICSPTFCFDELNQGNQEMNAQTTATQKSAPVYTILDGEFMINAPVKDVWPHLLNFYGWQNFSVNKHISGKPGEEGEVILLKKEEPGSSLNSYYARTIKLEPGRRIV